MNMIRLGLVEDHPKFRAAFLNYLKVSVGLRVVIEAENGVDLLMKLESIQPDVILLDIQMPIMNGFEAAKAIQKQYPKIKIIVLTDFDNDANIIEMFKLGVNSFVSKDRANEIPTIIELVHNGGAYYPEYVVRAIQRYVAQKQPISKFPTKLSTDEITLIQCICKGLSSASIADILNKSPRTIERYRLDLYQKVGVKNKEQLIVEAGKWSFF
jgi:DNA-binding NarL/FixJ family response regulator